MRSRHPAMPIGRPRGPRKAAWLVLALPAPVTTGQLVDKVPVFGATHSVTDLVVLLQTFWPWLDGP